MSRGEGRRGAPGRLAAALLWGALSLAAPGMGRAQEGGVALVYLGDGSSVPLGSWAFSYEFASWNKGEAPSTGTIARRDKKSLWLGKKEYPLQDLTLEVVYEEQQRPDENDATKTVRVKVPRRLMLKGAAGKQDLKIEAPARDVLLSAASSNLLFMPRGLDFQGLTLTGTPRSFCLLSFTSFVECGTMPSEQIVKIEFSK
jgi:hypothetical protein